MTTEQMRTAGSCRYERSPPGGPFFEKNPPGGGGIIPAAMAAIAQARVPKARAVPGRLLSNTGR